jgi:hypothetical protein
MSGLFEDLPEARGPNEKTRAVRCTICNRTIHAPRERERGVHDNCEDHADD